MELYSIVYCERLHNILYYIIPHNYAYVNSESGKRVTASMRAVGACEQLEHAIREIDSVNLVLVKRKERNMVSVQFRCSNKCKHLEWRDASADETRRRREHPRAARAA